MRNLLVEGARTANLRILRIPYGPYFLGRSRQALQCQILNRIRIQSEFIAEADSFAKISTANTSDRHDFRDVGFSGIVKANA